MAIDGGIEPSVSYRAARFCSVQELLALIVRVLAENKDRDRT